MSAEGQPAIFLGRSETSETLPLKFANRHGLIAGATGTGKTVTLQIMAEGFSQAGVPVFLADVKGDLAGLSQPGAMQPFLTERAAAVGLADYAPAAFPVVFWDLFGRQGYPLRTTISEIGPLLLARMLELNETQAGVLAIAFQVADDEGLLLLDLKDLRSLLTFVAENAKTLTTTYGHVSRASVGAIQRRLLTLDQQGAEAFFGEPALALADFLRCDSDGRGAINILAADKLILTPTLYATFLLWLLSELFEELPEIGDPDKPRMVFFFDEAHLLFRDAPKALIEKVEQVVRLIRSKGVGVYFVTQNPGDLPDAVLGQLGNRVQHALRAFTPRDRKAVQTAADTFRQNPGFDARTAITELRVGEALVSTLQAKGVPSVVQRCLIRPPASRLGAVTPPERAAIVAGSALAGRYERAVDRESAYEILVQRAQQAAKAETRQRADAERDREDARRPAPARSRRQSAGEAFFKSTVRAIGSQLGRQLVRGILGSLRR